MNPPAIQSRFNKSIVVGTIPKLTYTGQSLFTNNVDNIQPESSLCLYKVQFDIWLDAHSSPN
jgi:hypothetical protein